MSDDITYVNFNGKTCIMPTHIQIETVGGKGMCTARCSMCTIGQWERPGSIMQDDVFLTLVEQLDPFKEHLEYITLHGCGEPLMDKNLHKRVKLLKERGFTGTGLATNCTLLTKVRAQELIEAGLDTIICSVDGFKKETHEAIRTGTHFEKVVHNIQDCIRVRNETGKTRILIRFIRQELNHQEFPEYKAYWEKQINSNYGDQILVFNIHNWGAGLDVSTTIHELYGKNPDRVFECSELYRKVMIYANGELAFCDSDYNGFFHLGSIMTTHFLEMFNSEPFTYYRQMMKDGRLAELEHCNNCTIPISRADKT